MVNKKYYLINLGCPKNLVEGEHLAGLLLAEKIEPVANPQHADLILINTCGFLTSAIKENIDTIFELAANKLSQQKLIVIGCLVGRFGKKLVKALPEVDLFIAPGETQSLIHWLYEPPNDKLAIKSANSIFTSLQPRALSHQSGWAYLRISDGCNHKCAFCVIPHIRGNLRSRTIADIITEAHWLVKKGVKEINIIAQDVTAYGQDLNMPQGLLHLLSQLNNISELKWIRLLYMYPQFFSQANLESLASFSKLLPYFDIPIQHISPNVLQAMNRSAFKITRDLKNIRTYIPQAVIRTSFIVGHPHETEEDFQKLKQFAEEFKFERLGCFVFEPQQGTKSALMPQIPPAVKKKRYQEIMKTQKKISKNYLKSLVGTTQSGLFIGEHPESELLAQARLWSQAPEVDGEVIIVDGKASPGDLVAIEITKAHNYDLEGIIKSFL